MNTVIDPEIVRVFGQDPKVVNRTFLFQGCEIHTQFMPCISECDTLIVRFHGAIQRERRPLPSFQANLKQMQGYSHQITLCDPTMMTRDGFSLGWYAGHEALDVQGILKQFFAQVREFLGIRRMIYLGSSGGGFAALHYSYFDPGSAAVVMGPQTSMKAHIRTAIERYISNCWPGQTIEEVSQAIETDMCALYAKGHENSVVFVQSAGDFLHNHRHMAPFVDAVHGSGTRENTRFLLISDFWGRHGHGGAIPHEGYVRWVMATIAASSLDGNDLLDAYTAAAAKDLSLALPSARRNPAGKRPDAFSPDEASLRLAAHLSKYHLRQPMEN